MKPLSRIGQLWGEPGTVKGRIILGTLLVLAGSLAYANTLHVPFVLDDAHIFPIGSKNMLEILLHGGSRRVVDLTFALNYLLHGQELPGYHLTNLFIHLTTALLLYRSIYLMADAIASSHHLTSADSQHFRAARQFISYSSALFFVLHPIQTQAVTYTIQRYTSLSALFYVLAVLMYISARLAYDRQEGRFHTWLPGGMALLAGILALGCKQSAATLPLMILCLEIALFRGRLLNRTFLKIGGLLCIVLLVAAAIHWRGSSLHDVLFDINAATSEELTASRTKYLMTQSRVVITYLRLLCFPTGQNLTHDPLMYLKVSSTALIGSSLLHVLLFCLAAMFFRVSRRCLHNADINRGVSFRLAAVGIVWFYCALLVESSIFPIRDVMFEHRVYLPSIGFFLTVTSLLAAVTARNRAVAWTLCAVVCLTLGGLTIARNNVWGSSLTLWQDAVDKAPNNPLALANLGGEYLILSRPEKSIPLFVGAIERNGNFQAFHLGEALQQLHAYDGRFTTGKEFMPADAGGVNPIDTMRYDIAVSNTLGLAYEYLGETGKALNSYLRAVSIDPSYELAWYNLVVLNRQLGNTGQATDALARLRQLNPALAAGLESGTGNPSRK